MAPEKKKGRLTAPQSDSEASYDEQPHVVKIRSQEKTNQADIAPQARKLRLHHRSEDKAVQESGLEYHLDIDDQQADDDAVSSGTSSSEYFSAKDSQETGQRDTSEPPVSRKKPSKQTKEVDRKAGSHGPTRRATQTAQTSDGIPLQKVLYAEDFGESMDCKDIGASPGVEYQDNRRRCLQRWEYLCEKHKLGPAIAGVDELMQRTVQSLLDDLDTPSLGYTLRRWEAPSRHGNKGSVYAKRVHEGGYAGFRLYFQPPNLASNTEAAQIQFSISQAHLPGIDIADPETHEKLGKTLEKLVNCWPLESVTSNSERALILDAALTHMDLSPKSLYVPAWYEGHRSLEGIIHFVNSETRKVEVYHNTSRTLIKTGPHALSVPAGTRFLTGNTRVGDHTELVNKIVEGKVIWDSMIPKDYIPREGDPSADELRQTEDCMRYTLYALNGVIATRSELHKMIARIRDVWSGGEAVFHLSEALDRESTAGKHSVHSILRIERPMNEPEVTYFYPTEDCARELQIPSTRKLWSLRSRDLSLIARVFETAHEVFLQTGDRFLALRAAAHATNTVEDYLDYDDGFLDDHSCSCTCTEESKYRTVHVCGGCLGEAICATMGPDSDGIRVCTDCLAQTDPAYPAIATPATIVCLPHHSELVDPSVSPAVVGQDTGSESGKRKKVSPHKTQNETPAKHGRISTAPALAVARTRSRPYTLPKLELVDNQDTSMPDTTTRDTAGPQASGPLPGIAKAVHSPRQSSVIHNYRSELRDRLITISHTAQARVQQLMDADKMDRMRYVYDIGVSAKLCAYSDIENALVHKVSDDVYSWKKGIVHVTVDLAEIEQELNEDL